MPAKKTVIEQDPLWYKDAIIYELHIKSFFDSNDDGIGDFKGLIQKLDYLEELGVNAVWLLPFYPSPLRDDGYDISDYFNINPEYGSKRDFKRFLSEAHKRDIKVITELVINHTSDQHPWFLRARKASKGSVYRDFYVWSDDPHKYSEARVIFSDFESSNWSWDSAAKAYYWHRFYHHQPDLNYENPRVQKEILRVLDYWFEMGVDGLRLDAIPYLFQREGTNCENLPETHQFLKKLRGHIDSKFSNRMLLAEANQWPEDAAAYFGDGDECHMAFHFPVMPRLFMSLRMEDRFPLTDILEQTSRIDESCQWAMFLRNHDELTLEMVTDEERDYMHRAYAEDPKSRINLGIRRRLGPLLGNNRRKIELMNLLLLSLPGTPVLYYGDEIGMGDNYYLGDRDGVRTPMQWSPDRNAGFSKVNPHKLYLPVIIDSEYHYAAVNVENQHKNFSSLWWWMKRIIAIRKRFKALGRGSIEFVMPENPKILCFVREYEDEQILVAANLSRFCQMAELDLSKYAGMVPKELFSSNSFMPIGPGAYTLTMGPHSFYWFQLQKQQITTPVPSEESIAQLSFRTTWANLLNSKGVSNLEDVLVDYLLRNRWFAGKGRTVRELKISGGGRVSRSSSNCQIILVRVSYTQGEDEHYVLPISFVSQENAVKLLQEHPEGMIAHLTVKDGEGFLFESIYDREFHIDLLKSISSGSGSNSVKSKIKSVRGRRFRRILGQAKIDELNSKVLKVEQSNTSIIYEDKFFLKLYRKAEAGVNPDVEISSALTQSSSGEVALLPTYAGQIDWSAPGVGKTTIAMLQSFVSNQSDAWQYTLDAFRRYLGRVQTTEESVSEFRPGKTDAVNVDLEDIDDRLKDMMDVVFLNMVGLLGERTGQMHKRLADLARSEQPGFEGESFSMLYQRSINQSMCSLTRKTLRQLKTYIPKLDDDIQREAKKVLKLDRSIFNRFDRITKKKLSAMKIRVHGDYHLGQVLFTGKDFVIIDFEGEPARQLGERRLKRSPLRDVAGLMKSFQYAAYYTIFFDNNSKAELTEEMKEWADVWYYYVSRLFLNAYMKEVAGVDFVPQNKKDFKILLDAFLLEKAVYELGYELNNRPNWLVIPIEGLKNTLRSS